MKTKDQKKSFSKINTLHSFIDAYFEEIKHCIETLDRDKIALIIDALMQAYRTNNKVFIIGNGGSASTASHMACDLGKGTLQRIYDKSEKRFQVISLTDNVSILTAFANDISFDDIFLQQLRNLVETDDVVIALSGSGNSKNIVNAIKYAKSCKAKTIGLLGFKTGGKTAKLVDLALTIDSNHYGPIEDVQLIFNHLIASWIAKIKNEVDNYSGKKQKNSAVPFSSKK